MIEPSIAAADTALAADPQESPPPSSPSDAELQGRLEAALLTLDRPQGSGALSELLGGVGTKAIHEAIRQLNQVYEETGRSFRIEQVAGGWRVMTLPKFADVLAAIHKSRAAARLSPSAMETLAIIAYKQPILRADVESIRGVASGEMIRGLMDRRLVKIVGRADVLGRPMLYGTTKYFLEVFGLASLKDLPKPEEWQATASAALSS